MRIFAIACVMLVPAHVVAGECWEASNFTGQSAESDRAYQFDSDRFADGMKICFTTEGGVVTGNDLELVRIGASTLIGWAANPKGLETVNVYQIDRARQKLLFTQSRIGTATVTDLLPDYAAVFVADVVPVD